MSPILLWGMWLRGMWLQNNNFGDCDGVEEASWTPSVDLMSVISACRMSLACKSEFAFCQHMERVRKLDLYQNSGALLSLPGGPGERNLVSQTSLIMWSRCIKTISFWFLQPQESLLLLQGGVHDAFVMNIHGLLWPAPWECWASPALWNYVFLTEF